MTTEGYIFDYGGTLDTAGDHWGIVIGRAYERLGLPVTTEHYREAYVHAERTLGRNPIIAADYTFRRTLQAKIGLQLGYLAEQGLFSRPVEQPLEALREALVGDLYAQVQRTTAHSAEVLRQLRQRYPLVLVSNFYGNIAVVLEELGFSGLFSEVVESAVVGVRKPDPAIFRLGVEALRLPAEHVVVVGDSLQKDILPARQVGCQTVWYRGAGWTDDPVAVPEGQRIITDLAELL